MLPSDFDPWQTVYYYFRKWKLEGVWEELLNVLHAKARKSVGKEESPSLGIIDSRSVKTSHHVDTDREDYKKALDDITKAINIDSAQPDNYVLRGFLYVEMEKYKDAINDLTKALESEDFKEEAQLYFYRALCYASTDKIKLARQDVQSAYNYTDDPELEDLLQDLWKRLH